MAAALQPSDLSSDSSTLPESLPLAPVTPGGANHVPHAHSHGHAMSPQQPRVETEVATDETIVNESLTEYQKVQPQRGDSNMVSKAVHSNDVVQPVKEQSSHIRDYATKKSSTLSQKEHDPVSALPPGIDPNNIIAKTENDGHLLRKNQPTSSAPTSSYTLRNRGAKQSKLVYDIKYHPMDDSIRPWQAAKRRSAHGEKQSFSDDSCDTISECNDSPILSGNESMAEESPKQVQKGKKRTRVQSRSPEPTRRSSRKTSVPKMSYNMDIHPQDEDLETSSDEESEAQVSIKKGKRLRRPLPTIELCSDDRVSKPAKTKLHKNTPIMDLTGSDGDHEPAFFNMEMSPEADKGPVKTSSPSSPVTAPPPYGIRRKEGLDVWKLDPGNRYFRHDRDSWSVLPGQPFEIFAERLEDQLAAEALALSPLNYGHDDKENAIINPDPAVTPEPGEGISVVPASQYRRSSENSQVSHHIALVSQALYDSFEEGPQPYGIGSSDGARDEQVHTGSTSPLPDDWRILASSEHLPRATNLEGAEAEGNDSVLGVPSSSSSRNIDSVIGGSSHMY